MIRNKLAVIASIVLLCICMSFYFPFPNNQIRNVGVQQFISFPIRNQDGYVMLGIIGSVLFVVAIILLVIGIKKYRFQTVIIVLIVYTFLPKLLIGVYQETLASGISAISYDNKGTCNFEYVGEDVLNGECSLVLHNHSNETVSFELEFLDSILGEDEMQMESLMNIDGPNNIVIEANSKKYIHLEKSLELSDVIKHIDEGSSTGVQIKLIDGGATRIL